MNGFWARLISLISYIVKFFDLFMAQERLSVDRQPLLAKIL